MLRKSVNTAILAMDTDIANVARRQRSVNAALGLIGIDGAGPHADHAGLSGPTAPLEAAAMMDTEPARFQLFNRVVNGLKSVSETQPLVILLENLHAADHLSLLLLEFMAQRIDSLRMLLVGTLRDGGAADNAIAKTLVELSRLPHFKQLDLGGFKAEEIEHLVNSIAGMAISPEQVHDIFSKTGGNPLFVIEIGKHLSRQRHQHLQGDDVLDSLPIPVPGTIRVALRQRFAGLSQTCREFLRIAAVMGREFEFSMVCQSLPNAGEETLLADLEEALDAGIIEDAPELDRYRFHYILMQQVVYESISKARRLRLHDQVGLCMETVYTEGSDVRVDQLLYHFEASGAMANTDRVAHYANLAGEQALQLFAYEEARDYFQRALRIIEESVEEGLKRLRPRALFGLGRAQAAQGQGGHAVESLGKAFDLFLDLGQIAQAVSIAEYPHLFHYIGEGIANRIVEQTLGLIDPDSHEAGRILSRYCRTLGIQLGDPDRATAAYQTALQIAIRENDRGLEMKTLANGGSLDAFQLDWRNGLEKCLRAIDLAPLVKDDYTEASAHGWAARCHYALGGLGSGRWHAASALKLASKLGDRYWLGTANWLNEVGAHLTGDWDTAIMFSDHCLALSSHDSRFLGTRALLAYQLGDAEEGNAYLERLLIHLHRLEPGHVPQFLHSAVAIPSIISLISGENDLFDATEQQARALLSSATTAPLVEMWARVTLALVAVQRGDGDAANAQYACSRYHTMLVSGTIGMAADRLLGLLSETEGRIERAADHLRQAYQFCLQGGYRPEAAWCLYDSGRNLMHSSVADDRQRARELMGNALAMAHDLRMQPLMDRLSRYLANQREVFSRLASGTDDLSQREIEVIRLIARGKTNLEISEELCISPHTVVRHVTNILAKTGAANRAEAAVYAALCGLIV